MYMIWNLEDDPENDLCMEFTKKLFQNPEIDIVLFKQGLQWYA